MNVVIDSRMYAESGIGRYIRNLVFHLQRIDSKNRYFLLLLANEYQTLRFSTNFKKVLADFRWYGIKEQIKLLGLLKLLKADLVHFPHFNVPIFFRGKFIVTIHDLIHQHFFMKRATTHGLVIYKIKQMGYRLVFNNALLRSSKILVPSQFVKGQLIKDWHIDAEKITVTPEAVDDQIIKNFQFSIFNFQLLSKKFHIKKPYIYYVGNAHPHKNVEGLIRAFRNIRDKCQSLQLVLSGHDHYFWQRIKNEFQDEDIIYTGQVTDEELVILYKNAEMFAMPSFEEGFGIPVLEAMACGCPVVSSDRGALKEVGGEAAIYFDPKNQGNMADTIDMVLSSEDLRKQLIKRGSQRVRIFSWKNLAEKTLEAYYACCTSA